MSGAAAWVGPPGGAELSFAAAEAGPTSRPRKTGVAAGTGAFAVRLRPGRYRVRLEESTESEIAARKKDRGPRRISFQPVLIDVSPEGAAGLRLAFERSP